MKTGISLMLVLLLYLNLIIVFIFLSQIQKEIKSDRKFYNTKIEKLNFLIQDMKEKNNDTCVQKYYEIENTLNKIKVKLRI